VGMLHFTCKIIAGKEVFQKCPVLGAGSSCPRAWYGNASTGLACGLNLIEKDD